MGFSAPGTNAVLVLPPAGDTALAPTWAPTTAYSAGARVLANSNLYVCLIPGVSGSSMSVFTNDTVTDGAALWRRPLARARQGFAITIDAAGDAYVSLDGLAVTNRGIWLKAGHGPFQISPAGTLQGGISVVSTSAVYTVTGAEW